MILSEDMYVPALRWRLGEYQAMLRLNSAIKDRIMPLICIPEVEFDFELQQPKRTIDDHVNPFLSRYHKKWGTRSAWISLDESIAVGRMDDGRHVFDFIFDGIRPHDARAVPALLLTSDSDTLAAASRAIARDGQGVGLLVRLEDLMTGGTRDKIVNLSKTLAVPLEETDLIIDLRAPNFQPYNTFAAAMIAALRRVGDLTVYRNFVLVSTAIPKSFKDVAGGTDVIPRHDWLFYQVLQRAMPSEMRRPVYGDYTIVHPDFVALNMRIIKSAGKVIYTTAETWATRKGRAFRDDREQMHTHCDAIVNESEFQFRGATFSSGDSYIAKCAVHQETPSNLSRWKEVAINHHITAVVDDLAKYAAASWRP